MKKIYFFMMLLVCAAGSKSATLTANFDSFQEGYYNKILHDGGITFSELDDYLEWTTNSFFVIDDASQSSWHADILSPPNILGFWGYAPGPSAGLPRFGSARIRFGGIADMASMDVFVESDPELLSNQLTLQAFYKGSLVAENVLRVPRGSLPQPYHKQFTISNTLFDDLRLVSSGPSQNGAVMLALDNVHITLIPEPGTVLLLGLGGLVGGRSGKGLFRKQERLELA